MLVLLTALLGCSDPVYYPQTNKVYEGWEGDYDYEGADGEDGAGGTPGAGDDLSEIPCSADPLGAADTVEVTNRLGVEAYASVHLADCSVETRWSTPPGSYSLPTFEGEVWIFTNTAGTEVFGWVEAVVGDADTMVLQ